MGKIIKEYETEYEVGDVVLFDKDNHLLAGIIEGYYVEDGNFWFNIRTSRNFVYTYSNGGDIGEWDIICKIEGDNKEDCYKKITSS